jgi:arsenate reductase (thioredoxin)
MPRLQILFLCTGNSCRSQMAEGWARFLKPDAIDSYSAGTEPRGLDRRAVEVMAEAGIDISEYRSKHLAEFINVTFDFVITVCDSANEACPFFPGKTVRLHRSFDDPPRLAENARTEEEALVYYRRVRDEMRAWVEAMPQNLFQK